MMQLLYIRACTLFIRCFLSGGSPASTPAKSRVVEALCILLCQKYRQSRKEVDLGKAVYKSRWRLIISEYNNIRERLLNSPVLETTSCSLMLYSINETTLIKWFKNEARRDEITLLNYAGTVASTTTTKVYYPLNSFPLVLVHLRSILTPSLSQKIQLEE